MKSATLRALVGSILLVVAAQPSVVSATHHHQHYHRHLHQRGNENHTEEEGLELVKPRKLVNRSGQCAFPDSDGLVAITPGELNAGWALSPDQECVAKSWCPFACPPGKLMNQWKKGTTYTYPESMYGGLYCDEDGSITKPFEDEDYCVEGVGTVSAVNNCGKVVAVCQTVLPGNEAMLIPTSVDSSAVIAVPGTSYWDSTAAHFYVNPPGYTTEEACLWGTSDKEIGNWSPYVIGANQDATGDTFVKIGWNPIYTESFNGVLPSFGMKVECNGNCVGLPCSIDPSSDGFGGVTSDESATGAGGADFCVVTVTSGSADIVFFNTDGSSGDDSSSSKSSTAEEPEPTTSAVLQIQGLHAVQTTTSSSSETPTPTTSSTSTTPTTTSVAKTTSTTSSTSQSAITTSSHSTFVSSSSYHASSVAPSSTVRGGIFQEDGQSNETMSSGSNGITASDDLAAATSTGAPAATTSSKSDATTPDQSQGAFAGLVVAIVAAACLY